MKICLISNNWLLLLSASVHVLLLTISLPHEVYNVKHVLVCVYQNQSAYLQKEAKFSCVGQNRLSSLFVSQLAIQSSWLSWRPYYWSSSLMMLKWYQILKIGKKISLQMKSHIVETLFFHCRYPTILSLEPFSFLGNFPWPS